MISLNLVEYRYIWISAFVVTVAIVAFLAYLAFKAYQSRITTGEEGIIGEYGVYQGDGLIQVHGEIWKIDNANEFTAGDRVEVISLDRLIVKVKRV